MRRRPARLRTASLAAAACLLALLGGLAPRSATAGDGFSLADANRRWRGARCCSRQEISFKKGEDSDGKTKSDWIWWEKKGTNHRARFLFENAEALLARFRERWLPPGTEFEAVGWGEERPGGAAFLDVTVSGLPVRARLHYYSDWGRVDLKRLEEFERWVRLEVFEILETPEEALVEVPSGSRASAAPQTRPLGTPARALALRLLAVAVEPARVAPGEEVRLVATYAIEGLAPQEDVEVEELRTITRAGIVQVSLKAAMRRASGLHQSSQPLRLPSDAAPGLHELRLALHAAGTAAEGTAIFEVKRDEH